MNNKALAIRLATTEKEDDVIQLLKNEGYWDDFRYWRSFGDNDNNFSTIGNQQSAPDTSLVEKFINSVDAILMKECMIRDIDMTGPDAPQSIPDALKRFYDIREGQISYLDSKTRNKMSNNIICAATGSVSHMNLTLADRGEGQTPNSMPNTILSISKNNKLKVPFVQGKFNMGGTGVLPFCGEHKLQLVISKRCPQLPSNNDDSFDEWSVTVVRREKPREGRRSTMFTYLVDENKNILRFKADTLPIIPVPQNKVHENMEYGTYFKLFNYAIPGYKTNILFDFNYRMSTLMPELAHPIRLRECRENYKGHSFETTLSGLQTRLVDDRENNIEDGFPCSDTFSVDGQTFKCSMYVFKKGKAKNYRKKEGILYIVNGQTHATANDSFFNRVNLSYLADSMLILVDCSEIDVLHREDMFMNSRDRLRGGEFVKSVENQIREILKSHPGLRKLQNERRAEAVQERLGDDKPLQNVLQNILTKSPVLSKILLQGTKLNSPFNIQGNGGEGNNFVGKLHPTFFNIKGKLKDGILIKHVPINHDFRVQFETDVENEYFTRPSEQGELNLCLNGVSHPELKKHLGLFDGTATLTITLPDTAQVGEQYDFQVNIIDNCLPYELKNTFRLVVEKPAEPAGGGHGKRTPPKDDNKPGNRQTPGSVGMPNVQEKKKEDWEQFEMDKDSALVLYVTEDSSDYYINMDNQYLLTELKGVKNQEKISLTRARYKYSMALVGMSIQSYYKNNDDKNTDIPGEVKRISSMIAPILIPMIEVMSDLEIDESIEQDSSI